jgi:succinyl-CoA synthetase beta subunit
VSVGADVTTQFSGALVQFARFGIATQAVEIGGEILRCSLAISLDRAAARSVVTASRESGVPLRDLQRINPRSVHHQPTTLSIGLRAYQVRTLASAIELSEEFWGSFIELAGKLYICHITSDALHSEINPLVLYENNLWVAQGGSLKIDPNAHFRQTDIPMESSTLPDMNYVPLDGVIGCIVNGGGLALATLGMIRRQGGLPANFLDIGGGSIIENLAHAYEYLNADEKIRVILVNLFCGVTWCMDVARDFLVTLADHPPRVPLVIRLGGFDGADSHQLMSQVPIQNLHVAMTLQDAVFEAVKLARAVTG